MEESSKATTALKLVISKTTNKVIFAEAKKDFVDLLFHILSFPVGSIAKLLITNGDKSDTISSMANLYHSLGDLNKSEYLVSGLIDRTTIFLLEPTSSSTATTSISEIPRLHFPTSTGLPKKYYKCSGPAKGGYCTQNYVADFYGAECPYCRRKMTSEMKLVSVNDGHSRVMNEGGYVKGASSYMVMDDLKVLPSSGVSTISLFISNISRIEERVISVEFEQVVSLLKASLQSKTVLTDVFLCEKPIIKKRTNSNVLQSRRCSKR